MTIVKRLQPKSGVGMLPEPQPPQLSDEGKFTAQVASAIYGSILALNKSINGRLSLGTGEQGTWTANIDGQWREVLTPATPDLEFQIPHDLQRLPIGYIVVRADRACIVYESGGASWSETALYLKCNVAGATLLLLLF